MKRYTVHKEALKYINTQTIDAVTSLGSEMVITDESLEFKNLPLVSIVLTDEQVSLLKSKDIFLEEEKIVENALLAAPIGYEKVRGYWYKTQKKAVTGRGCKVMVIDTGCNNAVVPVEFQMNFIDPGNEKANDVFGHGTMCCSIIKHPEIALAPDCTLYVAKCLTDDGHINTTTLPHRS